jgi:hypothetical protein
LLWPNGIPIEGMSRPCLGRSSESVCLIIFSD